MNPDTMNDHTPHAESADQAGHESAPAESDGGHHDHHAHMVTDFRRRFWVALVLTVPILLLSPLIQGVLGIAEALQFPGDLIALWGLSTAVFVYGGWPFLKGIYEELADRTPGMMTLIAVAITTAYVYSSAVVFGLPGSIFFWELATLIDVMLVGHWIEMRSVMGASKALEELAKLMPQTAHRLTDSGDTEEVPLDELQHGDRVLIRPGEKIPADGDVVDGESSGNEAMLTGESVPVPKGKGDEVSGGAINGEGALTVAVQRTGEEGYLSQVITMVEEAQATQSKTQDLANWAAVWLTGVALGGGALTMVAWAVVVGADFAYALERTVSGQGKTVVFVLINGELEGAIALADVIRDESRDAIAALKGMGLQVMILTGDNRQVAA